MVRSVSISSASVAIVIECQPASKRAFIWVANISGAITRSGSESAASDTGMTRWYMRTGTWYRRSCSGVGRGDGLKAWGVHRVLGVDVGVGCGVRPAADCAAEADPPKPGTTEPPVPLPAAAPGLDPADVDARAAAGPLRLGLSNAPDTDQSAADATTTPTSNDKSSTPPTTRLGTASLFDVTDQSLTVPAPAHEPTTLAIAP